MTTRLARTILFFVKNETLLTRLVPLAIFLSVFILDDIRIHRLERQRNELMKVAEDAVAVGRDSRAITASSQAQTAKALLLIDSLRDQAGQKGFIDAAVACLPTIGCSNIFTAVVGQRGEAWAVLVMASNKVDIYIQQNCPLHLPDGDRPNNSELVPLSAEL